MRLFNKALYLLSPLTFWITDKGEKGHWWCLIDIRHQNNDSILLGITCTDKCWRTLTSFLKPFLISFQFECQTKRYCKLYSSAPETNMRFYILHQKVFSSWAAFLISQTLEKSLVPRSTSFTKQAIQFIWHVILTCFCFWSVKHAGLFEDPSRHCF